MTDVSFSAVTNPVYANPEHTAINCMVTVSEDSDHQYAGQTHPFTCVANDPMQYGADLWIALQAGTYGPIGAYVAPTLSAAQQAQAAIVAGINLTSTGTPALNGTYPLHQLAQNKLNGLVTYILLNNAFPDNQAVMPWYDVNNTPHMFSVSNFKNFATAFTNFIALVMLYGDSNGALGSIPSNNITIP